MTESEREALGALVVEWRDEAERWRLPPDLTQRTQREQAAQHATSVQLFRCADHLAAVLASIQEDA